MARRELSIRWAAIAATELIREGSDVTLTEIASLEICGLSSVTLRGGQDLGPADQARRLYGPLQQAHVGWAVRAEES